MSDGMNWMEKQMMEGHGIVIRPAPDGGVTVNGVGLWPDGPKDDKGYVYGSKGPWTARYNFETKSAEASYHGDDPLAGPRVVTWIVGACVLAAIAFLVSLYFGWFVGK